MKSLNVVMTVALTLISFAGFSQQKTSVKSKTQTSVNKYVCPMHTGVIMDKPGKCTTCGSELQLSPKEKMKRDVVKIYSCPMHTDEVSGKQGSCSKCKMALKETESDAYIYKCPMHADVQMLTPGECSKCGMELKLSKKDKTEKQVVKNFICPMHPDVNSVQPGKCPSCGMALIEKTDNHANHNH